MLCISSKSRSLLILLLFVSACGGAQSRRAMRSDWEPQAFFPMEKGRVWSYLVDTGEGESILALHRVVERQGRRVALKVDGGGVSQYELRAGGIYRIDTESWLMRAPLRVGQAWSGTAGRKTWVEARKVRLQTAAGELGPCVVIAEEGDGRMIRTTYCHEIGPVAVESAVQLVSSNERVVVEARLQGYQAGRKP